MKNAFNKTFMVRSIAWLTALSMLWLAGWLGFKLIEGYYQSSFRIYNDYNFSEKNLVTTLQTAVPLANGTQVHLVIRPQKDDFSGVRIQCVTWGERQTDYQCYWKLNILDSFGKPIRVTRSGSFRSAKVHDWAYLDIIFPVINRSKGTGLELVIGSTVKLDSCYVGIPLFASGDGAQKILSFTGASLPPVPSMNDIVPHYQLLYAIRKE